MNMRLFSLGLCVATLSGCAMSSVPGMSSALGTSPPAQRVDVVQLGDGQLTCAQMKAEIARMDEIVDKAAGVSGSSSMMAEATTLGSQAAGYLGVMSGIPGLSYLAMLPGMAPSAVALQQNSQMSALQAVDSAEQRKQNMVRQYNDKRCR